MVPPRADGVPARLLTDQGFSRSGATIRGTLRALSPIPDLRVGPGSAGSAAAAGTAAPRAAARARSPIASRIEAAMSAVFASARVWSHGENAFNNSSARRPAGALPRRAAARYQA